jgi:hypothetical protein
MNSKEFSEKVRLGLALSFRKLVLSTRQSDGYLSFCKDGKVVKVRAKDISLEDQNELEYSSEVENS